MTNDFAPSGNATTTWKDILRSGSFWKAGFLIVVGGGFASIGVLMFVTDSKVEGLGIGAFFGGVAAVGVWELRHLFPQKTRLLFRDPKTGALADIGSPLILTASRAKWLLLGCVSAGFVTGGCTAIFSGAPLVGWPAVIFFGAGVLISLTQLTLWRSTLHLSADGFRLSSLWRKQQERFDECSSFNVIHMEGGPYVGYDRVQDIGKTMSGINRALAGRSSMFPDTFGLYAEEFAELLNAYREAALDRAWQRHVAAVEECKRTVRASLKEAGTLGEIVDIAEFPALPEEMPPWPSFFVLSPSGSGKQRDHQIQLCVDVLSPFSRWFSEEEKREQAFHLLGAEELQIISPDENYVRRYILGSSDTHRRGEKRPLLETYPNPRELDR